MYLINPAGLMNFVNLSNISPKAVFASTIKDNTAFGLMANCLFKVA
jgi:hypothetical protein